MKTSKPRSMLAGAMLAAGMICADQNADAALMVNAAVGGAAHSGTYVNFDDLAIGAAGGTSNGVTVSFGANGQVVTGNGGSFYSAPYISGSSGAPFGDATMMGQDATRFISTGNTSATLSFSGLHHYIGMLWGSVDTFNKLEFFNGATLLGTLTGTDIVAGASGDQGSLGTYYANITSDLAFDKVVASSSDYAFEFDNVAYDSTAPSGVPEPAAIGLLGLGLLGASFVRRRKTTGL